jgi:hypothetical protein
MAQVVEYQPNKCETLGSKLQYALPPKNNWGPKLSELTIYRLFFSCHYSLNNISIIISVTSVYIVSGIVSNLQMI